MNTAYDIATLLRYVEDAYGVRVAGVQLMGPTYDQLRDSADFERSPMTGTPTIFGRPINTRISPGKIDAFYGRSYISRSSYVQRSFEGKRFEDSMRSQLATQLATRLSSTIEKHMRLHTTEDVYADQIVATAKGTIQVVEGEDTTLIIFGIPK